MHRLLSIVLAAVAFTSCASGSANSEYWEDWGGWLLSDHRHAIQHSVSGTLHRFVLQRVAEENDQRVTKWTTLQVIETRLADGEFMCMGAALAANGEEYLAFAREDESHTHPVTRAWRIDTNLGRLNAASVQGLACDIEECNDDQER